jgi:hypothetical protein
MRRLIGLALVVALALTFTGVSSFAATTKPSTKQVAAAPKEIKGAVTKVTAKTLTVKDEAGKSHLIRATAKLLEGIKVGDNVDVKEEKGKATSIEKVEGAMKEKMPAGKEMKEMPAVTPAPK